MKNIVIGQLMLLVNIAASIIIYNIVQQFLISEFLEGLLGFVAVIGIGANLFFSIAVQIKGYTKLDVL